MTLFQPVSILLAFHKVMILGENYPILCVHFSASLMLISLPELTVLIKVLRFRLGICTTVSVECVMPPGMYILQGSLSPGRLKSNGFGRTTQDHVQQTESLNFDLVLPSPPRTWYERYVVYNLIVSQTVYEDQLPCLVTIAPTIADIGLHMHAVALSMDYTVSVSHILRRATR